GRWSPPRTGCAVPAATPTSFGPPRPRTATPPPGPARPARSAPAVSGAAAPPARVRHRYATGEPWDHRPRAGGHPKRGAAKPGRCGQSTVTHGTGPAADPSGTLRPEVDCAAVDTTRWQSVRSD